MTSQQFSTPEAPPAVWRLSWGRADDLGTEGYSIQSFGTIPRRPGKSFATLGSWS